MTRHSKVQQQDINTTDMVVMIEGELDIDKKGVKKNNKWRRCRAILTTDGIFIEKNKTKKVELKKLTSFEDVVAVIQDGHCAAISPCCFKISLQSGRDILIKAENSESMGLWMQSIINCKMIYSNLRWQ